MAKPQQSKDDALEALDFIVNVLKEHEKDLDKLISELATVTEQIGDTGVLSGKVDAIEEKINGLQKEVSGLIGCVSGVSMRPSITTQQAKAEPAALPTMPLSAGASVTLNCKQWEDFQAIASKAQTLSFSYREEEKVFQADALKGNQIITYSGSLPEFSSILKIWLSKQLDVSELSILEGILSSK